MSRVTGKELEVFHDRKNRTSWRYIRTDKMKEVHRNGDYQVVGEIACRQILENGIERNILYNEKDSIPTGTIGSFKEAQYKTIGYIPCTEQGEYIAVKKKKNGKLILAFLLPLLVVVGVWMVGVWIGYILVNERADIDPAIKDFESTLKRPADIDSSKILVPGYEKWTIREGGDVIESTLFNPEGNPCYFKFTILEKESGGILYESRLVPPGKGISPIRLSKSFKKGKYPLVIKFRSIDLKDAKTEYNGSDLEVTLNVE